MYTPVLAGLVAGLIIASFAEYFIHRFMLHNKLFGPLYRYHLRHHKLNHAKGMLEETATFMPAAIVVSSFGFLFGMEFGIAFTISVFATTVYLAWRHIVHHEPGPGPNRHTIHHRFPRTNYAFSCTYWDRLFGTDVQHGTRSSRRAATPQS